MGGEEQEREGKQRARRAGQRAEWDRRSGWTGGGVVVWGEGVVQRMQRREDAD